jgi:hypothetical protein
MTERVNERKQTVWEGTWEELTARAKEFAGRRFRLSPLDVVDETANGVAAPEGKTPDKLLAPFLAEVDAFKFPENLPAVERKDPQEAAIANGMREKAKKLGLSL